MNFYEILKTKKLGRGSPDYWTQLFAEHVGGKGERTVTGVLPLTFTAKGGTAVDWVIEGNNDVGENLINVADFTVGVAETHNVFREILPAGTYTAAVYQNTALMSAERNTLAILKISGAIYESASVNYHLAAGWHYLTFTIAESENVDLRYWTVNASNSVNCTSVMLVKGSTAPDHYIPYQQGVGERTKNLFDIGTSASDYVGASIGVEIDGYNLSMNVVRSGGTWTYRNKKILTTGEHTVSLSSDKTYPRVYIALRNQDDSGWLTDSDASISGFAYNSYYHGWYDDNPSYTTGNLAIPVIIPSCLYWQIGFGFNSIANVGTIGTLSNIMLVEGSTAPDHYIPYGYQIPLAVSQAGQPDKTVDIYIGDTPLTEGETVSKTSTGVDIELFKGENTVSTALYNKPTMEIKYK